MPDTRFGGPIIPAGMLTPTPQRQAAFVGSVLGMSAVPPTAATGVYALQRLKTAASVHRQIVGPVSALLSAYSTVESAYKLHRGGYKPAFTVKYEPYSPLWVPPFPELGNIPGIRPRLEIGAVPIEQSRGGEHTSRSGTPSAGKSTPDPSAQSKSGPSWKKPRGMISRANRRGSPTSGRRRPRTVRYRKGGCPPGYRYDRRRKMCVLT